MTAGLCQLSIAHEIKNSKRNLPIALVVGPIFVLAVYILYFVGICILVGPQEILTLGDGHVTVAAEKIFGGIGSKNNTYILIIYLFRHSKWLLYWAI